MDTNTKRANFSGKVGFVLAAAASAVGLGNIWRFPYLAAKYGGGTFLVIYIILAVTFGFAVMITEIAIGRKTGLSGFSAFQSLDKRFSIAGLLNFLIPAIITPYYSVIGGWVMKYISVYLTQQGHAAAGDDYFGSYIGQTGQPILWLAVFIILTCIVVTLGVQKGIEKASVIMMPILIVLCVVISVFAITRHHALAGVIYYIKPDPAKINGKTVLAAIGQLFYSMSLAMGIMITYGSYMPKTTNLASSVRWISFFDTLVAFLAGLMIIPAVYVFSGGNLDQMNVGAGLMFQTLPKVFDSMPGGHWIALAFFVLVFFAAITSSISLTETLVSIIMDKLHWKRGKATLVICIYLIALGIPSSLGYGVWANVKPLGMQLLDFFDFVSNTLMMPVLAFLTCIFAGFVMTPKAIIEEVEVNGVQFKEKKFYSFMIKYVAPIGIVAILVSSVMASFGFLKW